MDTEEKQCIFPPIVSPRKLKYTGTYNFKKSSDKEEITIKHALFEMDATFHELQRSFDDFKYELENGVKKSEALEKYTGLIEEIHNEVPLLKGKDIHNSSTIGESKKQKEQNGNKGRKIITYTDWFKKELETGKDEGRFNKEYEKKIKKELQVIHDLDKQIKKVEDSFNEIKEEHTLCGKWNVIQNLSKNLNKQSDSKLYKYFRSMDTEELNYESESENDQLEEFVGNTKWDKEITKPTEEEIEKKSDQNKSVQELNTENKNKQESKHDEATENIKSKTNNSRKSASQSFIHRNIELAKKYSTISVSLTDEEKSRLETLLSEIDENDETVKPYHSQLLNSTSKQEFSTTSNLKANTKEESSVQIKNEDEEVFSNAFRLLDEDRETLNDIDCKLSGISGKKSTVILEEETDIEENMLEDERNGRLWKHEQLQQRLDQIELRLASLTTIKMNENDTDSQEKKENDLEATTPENNDCNSAG